MIKKEKNNKRILLIISLVMLVVILLVMAFKFFSKSSDEKKEVISLLKNYEDKIGSLDNLKYNNSFDDNHNFTQYYKGIEVYGGTVIATKNKEGISQILNYQYNIPDDFNINPVSKREDLNNIIKEYFGSDDVKVKLIIYPLSDNEFTLAHYCSKGSKYIILNDGDNAVLGTSTRIETANGENLFFTKDLTEFLESFKVKDNKYQLYDSKRNIEVYRIKDNDDGKYIKDIDYLENNTKYYKTIEWKKVADVRENYMKEAYAMQTVQKVYDYYQKVFGFKSIKLNEDYKLNVFTNMYSILLPEDKNKYQIRYDNAFLQVFDDWEMRIYIGAQTNYHENVEVIGHEYNHGYYDYIVDPTYLAYHETTKPHKNSLVGKNYAPVNMNKGINEGYADIMGQIIEAYYSNDKKLDGVFDTTRNIKDSDMKVANYNSDMEPHQISFIVSRVAYLMANNEQLHLNLNKLAKIWFNSIYKLPKHFVKFNDVEVAVLSSAKELGYSNDRIKVMAKIFTEVGYPDLSSLLTKDEKVIERSDYSASISEPEVEVKNDSVQLGIYANADESSIITIKENNKCEIIDRTDKINGTCSYEIVSVTDSSNYRIIFKLYDGRNSYYMIDNDKQISNSNGVLTLVDLSKSKNTLKPGTYKNHNMPEVSLTITLNEDNTCHYKGVSDSNLNDVDADCTYKYQRMISYGKLEDYIVLELNNGQTEMFEIQDSENMNSQWLMLKFVSN